MAGSENEPQVALKQQSLAHDACVSGAHLNKLAMRLYARYQRTRADIDLNAMIATARQAVESTEYHPDRAMWLHDLSVGLTAQHHRMGVAAVLDEAIQLSRDALLGMSREHEHRSVVLDDLGCQLYAQYKRTGTAADLDEAISTFEQAIDGPCGHPARPKWLHDLGNALGARYRRTKAMDDLDREIQSLRDSMNPTCEHLNRPEWLLDLKHALNERFRRKRSLCDVEEATCIMREVVNLTSQGFSAQSRVTYLIDLGRSLRTLCELTGNVSNLNELIEITRIALSMVSQESPDRPLLLSNLGVALHDRYERTQTTSDLENGIKLAREAVSVASLNPEDRSLYLSNLGVALLVRYDRTANDPDLEESIQVARQAIEINPWPNAKWVGILLHNLGGALLARHQRTKSATDLEEAIKLVQQAIDATDHDDSTQRYWRRSLGALLRERYLHTGSSSDLDQVIQTVQDVLDATPSNTLERGQMMRDLALNLNERAWRSRDFTNFEATFSLYRSALYQTDSPTFKRIEAGIDMVEHCTAAGSWEEAYEAAEAAVRLIPKLTLRSLEVSDLQYRVGRIAGLACDAAAIAIKQGADPMYALDLLETGRGVLATSLAEKRADVSGLNEAFPDLATAFLNLCEELDRPTLHEYSTPDLVEQLKLQDRIAHRSNINTELDDLITEIRSRPGFDTFLLGPSRQQICEIAEKGPIAVVNVSRYRCDAILITRNAVRSIALPHLRVLDVDDKLRQESLATPEVLQWLWDTVGKPVVDELGFTENILDKEWPHMWWVLTGRLSKFPVHAAGYHRSDSTNAATIIDRVMSSYSLSVRSIVQARHARETPTTASGKDRVLLVAMENTPGNCTTLPFVDRESDALRKMCGLMDLDCIEPGRCKDEIMPHIASCRVFHFAGHGYTHSTDPSKSYLALQDWTVNPLTVANLLDLNLHEHPPLLAYLSACGTGQIKVNKFLDEGLNLISACQLAGFRHVIGTLWEVNDEACADVARITYEEMKNDGMSDDSICQGLHAATLALRDRWLSADSRGRHSQPKTASLADESSTHHRVRATVDGYTRIDQDDRGGQQLPRDVELCDEDETENSLQWVPYVHFGV